MSKSFFLLCGVTFLLLFSCGSKQKQLDDLKKYPTYEEVATAFFEEYSLATERQYMALAKKPDGWYLVVTSYNDLGQQEIKDILFWSLEDEAYVSPETDGFVIAEPSPDDLEFFLYANSNPAWYANRFPYIGYPGYEDATIELLEGVDELNDTLLHALANAYFGKTQWIISLRKQEGPGYTNMKPEITSDSLELYLDYAVKSLDTYQKIVDRNPSYETWVGNIKTKMSNDAVAMYSELDWRHRTTEAKPLLEYVNYPNSMLDYSHNLLASCDSNGILFTVGDNDTYPLWYQQYKGFRKDVAVINLSLINVGFYIEAFKEKYDLPLSLPADVVSSTHASIIMVDNSNTVPVEMDQLAEMFTAKIREEETKQEHDINGYFVAPAGTYIAFDKVKHLLPEDVLKISEGAPLYYEFGKGYLLLADWIVLNLVAENCWKRPIYFTSASSFSSDFNYFSLYDLNQGMVIQLLPYITTNYYNEGYDSETVIDNLEHKFTFSKREENVEEERILANDLNIYVFLSDALLNEGDTARALHYLNVGVERYPMKLFKDPTVYLYAIYRYLEMEQKDTVIKLVGELCDKAAKITITEEDERSYVILSEQLLLRGYEKESTMVNELINKM